MRLEPAALRSWVQHSTTEPLRSPPPKKKYMHSKTLIKLTTLWERLPVGPADGEMQVVFSKRTSLEACIVGIGLVSFSSIGFIVVLCLLNKTHILKLAYSSKITRLSHWILEIRPQKYSYVLKNKFFPLLFPLWNISPMLSLPIQQRRWMLSHFFQTQQKVCCLFSKLQN